MKKTVFLKGLITLAITAIMIVGFTSMTYASSISALEDVECGSSSTEQSHEDSNVFDEIFAAASEFSTEITSVMAFIGSLIVALAYKRGLLPSVKNGIGAIGCAISQIKDSTESYSRHQDELLSEFTERLCRAEDVLERFGKAIDEIAEKTEDTQGAAKDRESMKALMTAQIDMLYDIFMTSSLPQYQKDAVNERIREMKEVTGIEAQAE